jgi:hypothetical protein
MRRVRRVALAPDLQTYLDDKQQEIDSTRAQGESPDITIRTSNQRDGRRAESLAIHDGQERTLYVLRGFSWLQH